jgi:hypothetical protein
MKKQQLNNGGGGFFGEGGSLFCAGGWMQENRLLLTQTISPSFRKPLPAVVHLENRWTTVTAGQRYIHTRQQG